MATIRDRYVLEVDVQAGIIGIDRATTATNNLNNSMGRIRSVAATAAGALAAIGAVNLAGNAIETYTAYERLTTQIATYTGGLANARTELERLEQLSVKLPQDLNDIAEAFTILTRTGIDTTNESLSALSEIAAANGRSLTQLAEAVADGMVGEFERFKEFGIKVSKEGDNLVARIGDQQVAVATSSTDLVNQLISLGEEGGRFFGAAAANAETLSQSFSNLNGAVSIAQREFVEGLKPGLQAVTESITTLMTENSGLLESLGRLVGDILVKAVEIFPQVVEAVRPLQPVFELLGTVLTEIIGPALSALFSILGQIAEAITPIVESAIPALQAGFEGIRTIIESLISAFESVITGLRDIYTEAVRLKDATVEAFNSMAEGVTSRAEAAYDGVTGWFGSMYDYVVGNSVVPDMVNGVLNEFVRMDRGMLDSIRNAVRGVTQSFTDIGRTISTNFQSFTTSALSGIAAQIDSISGGILGRIQGLANTVSTRLGSVINSARNAASNFSRNLPNLNFGGRSGGGGNNFLGGITDAFSGFKNLFGGFFANGGYLPGGKVGVVGERGPELISGPANITPMGSTQVVYNINAVDALSFKQLLARDPGFIHAVAQQGSKRIPQRRL